MLKNYEHDLTKRLVTPAFLEARQRKLKNGLTYGRVFPLSRSDESKSEDVNKQNVNKDGSKVAHARTSSVNKVQYNSRNSDENDGFKSRSSGNQSHRSSRSLDTALSLLRREEDKDLRVSRIRTSHSIPGPKLPTIDHRSPTAKTGTQYSRHSSRLSSCCCVRRKNDQKQQIEDWFSTASAKEKEVAFNLLSVVSPSLCPVQTLPTYCPRCNAESKLKKPAAASASGNTTKKNHLNYPTNAGALAYNTSRWMPHEFIIHPEWTEPSRKEIRIIETPVTRSKDEPVYGYWRK